MGALAAAVPSGVLLVTGVGHCWQRRRTHAELAAHRTLGEAATRIVASLLGPLEIVLGAAGLVALWAQNSLFATAAGSATAGLYGLFACYLATLAWGHRAAVPCACAPIGESRADAVTFIRAASLAAIAASATTTSWTAPSGAYEVTLVLLAGVGLTILVVLVPAAVSEPKLAEAAG